MIIYIDPVRPKRVRRAAIVLTCAGLTASLVAFRDVPVAQAAGVVVPRAGHAEVLGEKREITRPTASGVFADPVPIEASRRMLRVPPHVGPQNAEPSLQIFRFLGRVTAEGEMSVVLYGRGRTLVVRGTGPLDDDYAFDAIEEDYLVLRQVHQGASQMLKLTSERQASVAEGSTAETAED